jgi:hypothetical protein
MTDVTGQSCRYNFWGEGIKESNFTQKRLTWFKLKLATQTRGTSEFIPLYNWSHMGDCVWQISLFLKRRLSFLFPFSFIFICHYDHILGFHFNIHVQWGLNQVNRFWVKLLSFIPSPQKLENGKRNDNRLFRNNEICQTQSPICDQL